MWWLLAAPVLALSTDGSRWSDNAKSQDTCMIMNEDSHAWGGVHKAAYGKDHVTKGPLLLVPLWCRDVTALVTLRVKLDVPFLSAHVVL